MESSRYIPLSWEGCAEPGGGAYRHSYPCMSCLVCSELLLLRIKVTSGVLTKSKSQCNFDSAIFHEDQIQVESSNVRYIGKVITNSKRMS